jgi:hypothetical protein
MRLLQASIQRNKSKVGQDDRQYQTGHRNLDNGEGKKE